MTTATETHDNLKIAANNLLDGREYEQHLAFLYPNDLREGDVITDGIGTYQVSGVGNWGSGAPEYVRHIRISHTLAGPIMGGLIRGPLELVHVLARRR
jgi:hypothetical protein